MAVTFRDAEAAFADAIRAGRLTDRPHLLKCPGMINPADESCRYAGCWMYMGTDADGQDAFKHQWTRRYLPRGR